MKIKVLDRRISVAPTMDDVESCNIPSEGQRLDGCRIGAWGHFVPTRCVAAGDRPVRINRASREIPTVSLRIANDPAAGVDKNTHEAHRLLGLRTRVCIDGLGPVAHVFGAPRKMLLRDAEDAVDLVLMPPRGNST